MTTFKATFFQSADFLPCVGGKEREKDRQTERQAEWLIKLVSEWLDTYKTCNISETLDEEYY